MMLFAIGGLLWVISGWVPSYFIYRSKFGDPEPMIVLFIIVCGVIGGPLLSGTWYVSKRWLS